MDSTMRRTTVLSILSLFGIAVLGGCWASGDGGAGGGTGVQGDARGVLDAGGLGGGGGSSPFATGGGSGGESSPLGGSESSGGGESPFESSASGSSGGILGSSGGGGSLSSGISGDKKISSLDKSQKQKVCEESIKYLLDNLTKEELCLFAAHLGVGFDAEIETDQQAQMACSTAKSNCEMEQEFKPEDACSGEPGGGMCSVTVGSWEGCEVALADRFVAGVKELPSCSEVSADFYSEGGSMMTSGSDGQSGPPEACSELQSECTEFYNGWVGPFNVSTEVDVEPSDAGVLEVGTRTGDAGFGGGG